MKPPIPDPRDGDKRALPQIIVPWFWRNFSWLAPMLFTIGFFWQFLRRTQWLPY